MKQQLLCRLAACLTALAAVLSLMSCGTDAFQTELQETTSLAEEITRTETETTVMQMQTETAASASTTTAASTATTPLTAASTTTAATAAATTLPRTTTAATTVRQTAAARTTTTAKQTTAARTTTTKKQTTTARTTTTRKATTTTKKTTAATTTTTTKPPAAPTESEVYAAMIAMQKVLPEGTKSTNADYYAWKGGIFRGGYGCAAFAFRLSDTAFGSLPARQFTDYKQLRVGDLLRMENDTHFVVVLEIRANAIVVAEGNYNEQVHWFREIPMTEVFSAGTVYGITRYPA